ncbi:MAG TPA: DoxX family protein [Anaeromyxobacter sp.]|nr:DoxX family protein [Anaeromyxobacter sp.]
MPTAASSTSTTAQRVQLALTILRVVVGIIFVVHGGQKLFVFGFGGVMGFFGKVGIPLPVVTAVVVTLVEFLGGLALVVGVVTRIAAVLIGLDMIGAILFVHLKAGFFNPTGFEYPLTLLAAAICLALAGAGAYSIDAAIGGRGR